MRLNSKCIILLLVLFLGHGIFAQALVNEGFEDWYDNSAFEEPEGWVTRNDLYPEFGVPFTVLKSTDASEGKYAAKLETISFFDGTSNLIIPSTMVYGQDINGGISYSWAKRLNQISFSFKYLPNGIDTGAMYIAVGYRQGGRTVNQGGSVYYFTKTQNTYLRVSLPLSYNSNHKCDTFVFVFLNSISNLRGNPSKLGTVLLVDDIETEWEDFPPVLKMEEPRIDFNIFPNPAKEFININGLAENGASVKVFDYTGKEIFEEKLDGNNIKVSSLQKGLYFLSIYSNKGKLLGRKYFHKE